MAKPANVSTQPQVYSMVDPRKYVLRSTSLRSSVQEAGATRESPTEPLVRVDHGGVFTEVLLSMERSHLIAEAGQMLGNVILSFADAMAKAKRTGKTYTLTYTVSPYRGRSFGGQADRGIGSRFVRRRHRKDKGAWYTQSTPRPEKRLGR